MTLEQLADKIDEKFSKVDDKFEKVHDKLDSHIQKVIRVEERYDSISGQVKVVFALIGAAVSAIITYITSHFK